MPFQPLDSVTRRPLRSRATPAYGRLRVIGALAGLVGLIGSPLAWAASVSCNLNSGGFVHASDPQYAATGLALVRTEQVTAAGSCSGGASNSSLTGVVQVLPDPPISGVNTHDFTQQASASASGSARIGALGAHVTAVASSTPMAYFYSNDDGAWATDNNYQASAFSAASASFSDELYIHAAPGANPLTKVSVKFTGVLSGSGQTTGLAQIDILGASLSVSQLFGIGGGVSFAAPGASNSFVIDLYPVEAAPFFGVTPVANITGLLNIAASASAGRALGCVTPGNIWCTTNPTEFGDYYAESTAVGAFGSTANFYIEILTPGASYSTGSGVAYATAPVPLPAPVWLFGSALLGLRFVSRPNRLG